MGIYRRKDSPFWWMALERPGQRPILKSTKVLVTGASPGQTDTNRVLARAIYTAEMGDLARGRHQLAVDRPTIRFSAFADWYRDHVSAKKRTHARERSALETLKDAFRGLWLQQVDKDRVREWMTDRVRVVAPGTVNRELDVLKHLMTEAVPKYLAVSPLIGVRRLRAPTNEPRILSRDEETRLLAAVDLEDRAVILCGLDTLMRLGDVVRLKRAHDHGTHLTVVDPKVRPYKVPVSSRLRAALDALPKGSDWYFPKHHRKKHAYGATATKRHRANRPNTGEPAAVHSIQRMFAAACQLAQIPCGRDVDGLTFHCLRHTGATRLLEAGVDLRSVMAIGGWHDIRSVLRYTRPTNVTQQAVEAIGRA